MKIEIIETLSKIVTIDASTVEEGINQVDQLYRNEEIILDTNDYLSTEYVPLDMVNVNSSKDKVAPQYTQKLPLSARPFGKWLKIIVF